MIKILLAVGSGSFLGGVLRFLASKYLQSVTASSFPLGTFAVNIVGCLLMGLFFGMSDRMSPYNAELRLFLTVGFCGGFTTFSAFSLENMTLIKDGNYALFGIYAGVSVFIGLAAIIGGHTLTKLF